MLPDGLARLGGLSTNNLTKEERGLLEAILFVRVIAEISKDIQSEFIFYQSHHFHNKKEDVMDLHVLRRFIHDLIVSELYTIQGIAHYTETPQEFIDTMLMGADAHFILSFARKVVELHFAAYPEVYQPMIKKILLDMRLETDKPPVS